MNHLIQTTSSIKMNRERLLLSMLVLLPRIASIRGKYGCRKHLWKNCLLTILCRESLQYHRIISIVEKQEMIHWCPNQMFRRSDTIALDAILIVLMITMLRLHMLILILTIHRGLTFMVCLMVHRSNTLLFAIILLQLVLQHLLSHLLVCGWLRRTNSSAGICLRWIRMDYG